MAQEYGAAQPIVDATRKIASKAREALDFVSSPRKLAEPKQDDSYLADRAKSATKQFADLQARRVAKKRATKPAVKRSGPLADKRVPRKKTN